MKDLFDDIPGISFFKSKENESYYFLKDEETVNLLFQKLNLTNASELLEYLWKFDTELSLEVREKMDSDRMLYTLKQTTTDILLYNYSLHGGCFRVSLKYLKSFKKNVKLNVGSTEYEYFMTSDLRLFSKELKKLHLPSPSKKETRVNPALSKVVIDKMTELGALFSLTKYGDRYILNYYKPGDVPYIVFLKPKENKDGDF